MFECPNVLCVYIVCVYSVCVCVSLSVCVCVCVCALDGVCAVVLEYRVLKDFGSGTRRRSTRRGGAAAA
jgi:hypothetical protein